MSRSRLPRTLLRLLIAALLGFGLFTLLWPGGTPTLETTLDRPGVGRAGTTLRVRAAEPKRGITVVRVTAAQLGREALLVEEALAPPSYWAVWTKGSTEAELSVELNDTTIPGLEPGELTVTVTTLGVGSYLRSPRATTDVITIPVALTPPSLGVTSSQNYAAQGGSGVVTYRIGATALDEGGRDGVVAGEYFFPGYSLPNGEPTERFALYGVPYDLEDSNKIRLIAEDALGNQASNDFLDRYMPRPMTRDTIQLSESFMESVVPDILANTPELTDRNDLLENYLQLNGDLRMQNARTLRELAGRSQASFLWSGAFLQLPNSQVTSNFADRRTYVLHGRNVDQQDHLGYDLASVATAPVPAANTGTVLLARYFGIYGNTMVLDHGYGLMSLYSHLSVIDVAEGDSVEKGHVIGRTGRTGLAGGDHLHFTMLLRGLPVNPIEWWDPNWVDDRLLAKLER